MTDLVVDAPLLACPDPERLSSADFQLSFVNFLARLADISKLRAACKSIRFWRDAELPRVLHDQQCYPFRHVLTSAFQALHSPDEFQLEDINTLATALLERSLRIEDAGDIKDVVVSSCSLIDDSVANREPPFVDHLCRVIALAVPVLGDGAKFRSNTYLASCGASHLSPHITASFTVDLVELWDGTYRDGSRVDGLRIGSYQGAAALFRDVDLVSWWCSASEQALVDICAVQAALSSAEPWAPMDRVREVLSFGSEFFTSARSLGFMHEPSKAGRLLRVCNDLVAGRNFAKGHWLRSGKGANDPQKMRGSWAGWRHDIDDEFHLHYWRSGNRLELANVVTHNDFSITP